MILHSTDFWVYSPWLVESLLGFFWAQNGTFSERPSISLGPLAPLPSEDGRGRDSLLLQPLQRNRLGFDEIAFDTQLGSVHNARELSASLERSTKCHLV